VPAEFVDQLLALSIATKEEVTFVKLKWAQTRKWIVR
jgi:hypothetical protein